MVMGTVSADQAHARLMLGAAHGPVGILRCETILVADVSSCTSRGRLPVPRGLGLRGSRATPRASGRLYTALELLALVVEES
jgi:hypothetical protein